MRMRVRLLRAAAAGVALAAALVAGADAAPPDFYHSASMSYSTVSAGTTADVQDTMSLYLNPVSQARHINPDLLVPVADTRGPVVAYMTTAPLFEATDARSPATLASFAYPVVAGLSDSANDERAVPYNNTNVLTMGPGGFGSVMMGRSSAGIENWTHTSETAISYIRPHVNVQMMFALEMQGGGKGGQFEGPGLSPHAYLTIDHRTRVDSADIDTGSDRFGGRLSAPPVDEPHTALAAGLDLGMLPTFLSQMGMNLSVVASRGQETGSLRFAVVGTTELPVDWRPHERPYQHPVGQGVEPYILASHAGPNFGSGSADSGGPPGTPGGPPDNPLTPISPVPEPMTLALVGTAGAAMLAHLRRRRTA